MCLQLLQHDAANTLFLSPVRQATTQVVNTTFQEALVVVVCSRSSAVVGCELGSHACDTQQAQLLQLLSSFLGLHLFNSFITCCAMNGLGNEIQRSSISIRKSHSRQQTAAR